MLASTCLADQLTNLEEMTDRLLTRTQSEIAVLGDLVVMGED